MSQEIKQSPLNRARKDKFILVFDLPPILKQIASKYTRNNKTILPDSVQFSIKQVTMPGITVKGTAARFAGDTLYLSTHSKDPYPPVSLKFNVDSGYNNYFTIDRWLNLLHDQYNGRYNAENLGVDDNFSDYQTDMTLYALDEYDKKVASFKYTKAFPTSIDDLDFDQTATDDMELECGFTFLFSQRHFEIIGGDRFNATLA